MMRGILWGVLAIGLCGAVFMSAAERSPADVRQAAEKAMKAGNFKDAYAGFAQLAVNPANDPEKVSTDLTSALQCLRRLGRVDETDDFREKVIAAHAKNWKLLWTAAQSCLQGENYGYIVAGKFYRGNRRGNDGRYVNAIERDRVRALQLMQSAMETIPANAAKNDVSEFYFTLANLLLDNRFGDGAWRLQYLTDISKLPDYEEGYRYHRGNYRGAPVGEDGMPVLHKLPKTWNEALTDGERWRWALKQSGEASPEMAARAEFTFASFLRSQFDVQTMAMAGYGRFIGRAADDDTRKDESGPYAVSTLAEDETIARLANGIKRFKLADEFNFIKILQRVGDGAKSTWGEQALNMLGQLFEDRQQYPRAAGYWKQSINLYGAGNNQYKQKRLDQIVGIWARFDLLQTKPAGEQASATLVFRNGKKASFTAHEINVKKLLDDVKAYIKTRPNQLNWEQVNIQDIGWRLVEKNQQQYLGKEVAKWDMDLQPREKHFDRRVKVDMPVKQGGAYLITAQMAGGNTTRIVLWLADTAIVKKNLDNGGYYFVADAVSGKPIPKATLECFGYRQRYVRDRTYEISVKDFAEMTDADGQVRTTLAQQPADYQWLMIATTPDGRFAYHGFTNIWGSQYYDQQYNQTKVFVVTDRPVYRPGQTVKFKVWVGQAQYDKEGDSPYAGKAMAFEIRNPKNDKVLERTYGADKFGGFDGELQLPKDTTLGVYSLFIPDIGGGHFRVEEYKKPEFEVKVDAPTEPIMLGDKITAKITAKYYFGAPVTNAKVKYKVQRTSHSANWFPVGRWDWFYEPGYWWFACDYAWYPGWSEWGCRRPMPWWMGRRWEQPEIVVENEVPIAPDGTVNVEIDTALAKAVHADTDHKYEITAEVTDQSRRTIVGQGNVLVARKPFKVYAWVNCGHYQAGDAVEAFFKAQTLDNKPVKGKGVLKLIKVSYDKDLKPVENVMQSWDLETDAQGEARQQMKAAQPGQYRLSYTVTDGKTRSIEGGYVFVVRGVDFDGKEFRFNDIELTTDKREYQAGETVKLMVNTNRADSTVVLFLRPSNGICLPPKVIRLKGKSTIEEIAVAKKDMPNFFVEAFTVGGGKVFDEMREVVVPPESRVTNVQITPSATQYKPGQKAKYRVKLTDAAGRPVIGSTVISIYDKSVEYISGGSNVPEIKAFFWKWRRSHHPHTESSLHRTGHPLAKSGETGMGNLGVFGGMVADLPLGDPGVVATDGELQYAESNMDGGFGGGGGRSYTGKAGAATMAPAPMSARRMNAVGDAAPMVEKAKSADKSGGFDEPESPGVQPTIRKNFADTALWVGNITTNNDGIAEVELNMPESLTTWRAKVWTMSAGLRVGQGESDVTTSKDLLVRLQAPRFFVQKDEVVISANIHNYLKTAKNVKAILELDGGCLALDGTVPATLAVDILPGGEKRVDWRVKVVQPGEATVRVKAISDEESDAMEMKFPVYIHGMLKTDSFCGAMRPADKTAKLVVKVPNERLPEQSRIEIRYSPSVASAMVDALPYLVDYPYGCTEQTLNRFLPTVITQRVLLNMGLNLKEIQQKRTNLNAQEIGEDAKRAADWKRNNPPNPDAKERNPVFDEETVRSMAKAGITALNNMQLADGGWGWFSGWGEHSTPHTTALVVHGLQVAKQNDVPLLPGMLEKGIEWLKRYQAEQVARIQRAPMKKHPYKERADNIDAMVFMVLVDSDVLDKQMLEFLYRDRIELSVYAKAMFGLALHKIGEKDKLAMILQNIAQFVVKDDENFTAYLRLPEGNYWWYWYGSETEAMGYYLKLLAKADPKGEIAPRLAKYMINNRKHASYWNSTRDTAICIEALADYIKASGEDKPDMTVKIAIDGKQVKEVKINAANFFAFDNKLVLSGAEVTAGQHTIEFAKEGTGPLYFNAYVTNFTLEDPIKKAGLEIRVDRKFYKLVKVDKTIKVSGARGQAVDQKVEKYERVLLKDLSVLKSGDLVEIELEIDSKNDYEYIVFEDMKAAGFEPVDLRSGYNGNDLNAYMELRDERVCFFSRVLGRGKHSVAYRMRAEIPGKFSALPTKASAMYAPELKANSDEMKIGIED